MKTSLKNIFTSVLALPLMVAGVVSFLPAATTQAQSDINITNGPEASKGENTPEDLVGEDGVFKTITNVLLFLIGAISVIMLIIGGIRYTTSGGNSTAVQGAKNTILYSIVGIIVAILAYAVVNFVVGAFTSGS